MSAEPCDAVIVGSGPNGLAAALVLARAGLKVEIFEAMDSIGGGCRTQELTLPGFRHDVCSTIQSMVNLSPFFADVDLEKRGVRLARPEVAFAHPLDGGRAAVVAGGVAQTSA
ncbi:MAG: NAD(P)-binding protein, partial [Acidimicrobiales bacterium]